MALIIEVDPVVEACLQEAAARQGLPLAEYVKGVLERQVQPLAVRVAALSPDEQDRIMAAAAEDMVDLYNADLARPPQERELTAFTAAESAGGVTPVTQQPDMSDTPPPLMALTLGDPAGIGPEIVLKAARDPETFRLCRPIAVGPADVAAEQARLLKLEVEVLPVAAVGEARFEIGRLAVLDTGGLSPGDYRWGELSAAAGRAGVTAVERAAQLAMAGEVDAIVTAPLNKEAIRMAGVSYPGHTEILGAVTGSPSVAMLLVSDTLRVIHVSVHCSLREAIERVTEENVYRTICSAQEALRRFSVERPRIAVAGLNPHAGEGGLFGDEEIRAIRPAIERARAEGLDATGPWPPDTIFWRASRGEFDVVVAQYHDMGHIAIKMHGFEGGVNVTLGLPIIRTSVDHGTAFDIAGRGIARHESLLTALRVAAQLARSPVASVV